MSRSTDKLIEALSTLGALLDRTINEVRALDRDFNNRLQQSVEDTESALRSEAAQQVEETRRVVEAELTGRFQEEIRQAVDSLRAEFNAERDRLQQELAQLADQAAEQRKEKAQLGAELQRLVAENEAETAHLNETATAALESLREELQKESQSALDALRSQFEEERDRLAKELHRSAEGATRLDSELHAERQRLDSERERLSGECERLIDERDRLNRELRSALDAAARLQSEKDEFGVEMEQVKADAAANIEKSRGEVASRFQRESETAIETLKVDFDAEREKLNRELSHAVDAAAKLEAERSGLIAEVQHTKDQAAADIAKARDEAEAIAHAAHSKVAEQSTQAKPTGPASEALLEEVARAESQLAEILRIIDDPATDLSVVIRKNVQKTELEAYLRGIRFATGG